MTRKRISTTVPNEILRLVVDSGLSVSVFVFMSYRAATFTHVNGTVSCLCNKCLQNWPTVYMNFSM